MKYFELLSISIPKWKINLSLISPFVIVAFTPVHFTEYASLFFNLLSIFACLKHNSLSSKIISLTHRHLKRQTSHWLGLPAFVDSSNYIAIASDHKIRFGALCRASVLNCPWIQSVLIQRPACQLWPMSSLFILDVYGVTTALGIQCTSPSICYPIQKSKTNFSNSSVTLQRCQQCDQIRNALSYEFGHTSFERFSAKMRRRKSCENIIWTSFKRCNELNKQRQNFEKYFLTIQIDLNYEKISSIWAKIT